jgi:hypothetical protein
LEWIKIIRETHTKKEKNMKYINIPHELNKIDIADLHTAFKKLKIEVAPAKRGSNEMDAENI